MALNNVVVDLANVAHNVSAIGLGVLSESALSHRNPFKNADLLLEGSVILNHQPPKDGIGPVGSLSACLYKLLAHAAQRLLKHLCKPCGVEVAESARDNLHVVRNLVGSQNDSVAVAHYAPRSINLFNSLGVVGRIERVALVNELNIDQAQGKYGKDQDHPDDKNPTSNHP